MHHYENTVFSRRKPQASLKLPGLFWLAMIAAAVLSVFMLSQNISAGDETPAAAAVKPLEEITIITTDGCPACVQFKDEWAAYCRRKGQLTQHAKVRFVQIETVPAAVNSRGQIIPVEGVASLARLLPKQPDGGRGRGGNGG